jgi:hypothetical protein
MAEKSGVNTAVLRERADGTDLAPPGVVVF